MRVESFVLQPCVQMYHHESATCPAIHREHARQIHTVSNVWTRSSQQQGMCVPAGSLAEVTPTVVKLYTTLIAVQCQASSASMVY